MTVADDLTPGGIAQFAVPGDGDALERTRNRLAREKGPSTAASTTTWQSLSDQAATGGTFDATRISLDKLEQMRRDPMIAFGLMFIKVYLARASWYIKSTDPQIAGFVDGALRRIYARFILQYTGCLDFGYQALVKNFERAEAEWTYIDPNDPDQAEKPVWTASTPPLLWKPFTALSPRRSSPTFDTKGAFNGIQFRPAGGTVSAVWPSQGHNDPDVPLDWALWCTNEKDSVFGSLWGYPRSGYAYRYWWAYWYRFGLADRAFEKWADPPFVVYHPTGSEFNEDGSLIDYTEEALGLAEKLRSGANVSVPSGVVTGLDERVTNQRQWELKQIETTVNFDALNDAFGYLDVAKLRAMMVPEQAFLEGKGGTSSRNVASTLGDVFEQQQAVIKAEIDDLINRYMIPQLVEANFGPNAAHAEIVTVGFDQVDVETAQAIIQAFAQNAPARLASVDFRKLLERLGVPLLGPKAAEAQAEKLAEEAAAKGPPQVAPKDGNAGVNSQGLYYQDGDSIKLEDEDGKTIDVSLLGRVLHTLGFKKAQEVDIKLKTEIEHVDDEA